MKDGSEADQRVIQEVIELSKEASKKYDDFNNIIKEPNAIQKFLIKAIYGGKPKIVSRVKDSALTNYNLLLKLEKSCKDWEDLLKNAMGQITDSQLADEESIILLEKYICAGYIARERIEKEIEEARVKFEESNMYEDSKRYEELKAGLEVFNITLNNLEKSRAMSKLSVGQLTLIRNSNISLQIALRTQRVNSMNVAATQIRNAVINAKNKQVLEGKKALKGLNDELLRKVSADAVYTAQEAKEVVYGGFYSVEAAKEAAVTVLNGCKSIKDTAEKMLPQMEAETREIEAIIEELRPVVAELDKKNFNNSQLALGGNSHKTSLPKSNSGLKF